MIEENLFKEPKDIEEEKKERLIEEKGVYYFEKENPETGEKKKYVNIMGVEIETNATEEDIKAIKKEIVLTDLDQRLIRKMAEAYVLRQPLMLEGAPAVGKTFLIKYFTKLLEGYGALPLTIYGTTRTDAEDIIGRWVPKTANESEKKIWDEFLESDEGGKEIKSFIKEAEKMAKRTEGKGLSREQRAEILQNNLEAKLKEIAQSIGLRSISEFEFKEGPLLKAYSAFGGKGWILDVEEMGVMPTNVQETFLPIGGESGKLANTLQVWANGRNLYNLGERTGVFFSSNPPEEVGARHEVTTPTASRLTWIRIGKEEARQKSKARFKARYTGGRKIPEIKPENIFVPVETPIDITKYELGEIVGLAIELFNDIFNDWYDKIGEKDRNQKFEIGDREKDRVLDNILKFQYRGEDGEIDLTISLKKAIELYYIDRLANKEDKEKMKKLVDAILGNSKSELLEAATPMIKGKTITDSLREAVKNIKNPEKRRREILKELQAIEEGIYKIPLEYQDWNEIEELVTKYNQTLKDARNLKEKGVDENDPKKGVEFLNKAKDELEKIEKISESIKKKIEEKKKLEESIGWLDEF